MRPRPEDLRTVGVRVCSGLCGRNKLELKRGERRGAATADKQRWNSGGVAEMRHEKKEGGGYSPLEKKGDREGPPPVYICGLLFTFPASCRAPQSFD